MMKKRFLASLLALSMVLGLGTSVFASDGRQRTEDDLSNYDEVVVFNKDDATICTYASSTDTYRTDIESAKAGVLALNLGELGLDALEDACLNELDAMAELEGVTLHEYTVLVPKNRAVSYTYYGTYNGVEFYTSLSSKKNITIEKNNFAPGQKLLQWSTNAINLVMAFANRTVSLAWSAISANLPSNYTVHTSDWTDYYINMEPITRSIYAKSGSLYVNVYCREYGMFRPYFVYHYNSTSGTPTSTTAFAQQMYPDLDSTTSAAALSAAYQQYVNDGFLNITMENTISFSWQ